MLRLGSMSFWSLFKDLWFFTKRWPMTSSKRTGLPLLPAAASPPAPPPSGARLTPFWSHGEFTTCSRSVQQIPWNCNILDSQMIDMEFHRHHWPKCIERHCSCCLCFSTRYRVFPKPHAVSINIRSKFKFESRLNALVWVGDCIKILQTRSASFSTQLPIYASVVDDSQHLEQTPVSAVTFAEFGLNFLRPTVPSATLQASEKAICMRTIARKNQRQRGPKKRSSNAKIPSKTKETKETIGEPFVESYNEHHRLTVKIISVSVMAPWHSSFIPQWWVSARCWPIRHGAMVTWWQMVTGEVATWWSLVQQKE